jgi:hypothetical protein
MVKENFANSGSVQPQVSALSQVLTGHNTRFIDCFVLCP